VTRLRDPLLVACVPYSLADCVASRGGIYQLILWLRRRDRGETSFARLLAAPRTALPYPPASALNAAANGLIGLSAGRARFQMRATVAVWQHA
jgi:hypothetical protein